MECQRCKKEGAEMRRQGSAYAEDKLNFAVLCDACQEERNEYWVDMWHEYYGAVMGG